MSGTEQQNYDVVVIGAGNAALASAVSAKENGAERVLVLEKAPREMRGGNTHWSGAVLRFAYNDPREFADLIPEAEHEYENFYEGIAPYTHDDFYGDLQRVSSGRCDPELSNMLVAKSQDTVRWMKNTGGVTMEPAVTLSAVKKGNMMVWARGLVVRAEHEGVGLSRSWFATAEKMGIEIRYGAAATELLVGDDGAIRGVKVRGDEGIYEVSAKAVVLGAGGFEANVQMRTQNIGPLVGAAKVRGTPHNQGDGLRMAMAIGAMPWGQWSGCHATPISADWGDFAPREMTDRSNRLSYVYSVMLNRKGKRFVDEGEDQALFTYAKFGRSILAEPGAKAWQIFDSKVLHLLEPRYQTSDPIVSDTLEGLIAQLDIEDKEQALKTLAEYNAAARDESEGYDPTVKDGLSTKGLALEKTNWGLKIDKPPYHAYSATGGITFTFGGLKVDKEARVVGTDWRPIKGLYCCGEMVGGMFYDNYPAGTGLVSGATFGRIAGRNAATQHH
ncbi:FAD-dependent tricarballylate dehydrogenase TcuA [Paracoccus sp. (in: a-proteobacteria)]|uniref:FAD-dependent tricarballylate dehydrogenase TcuA n=1 Tax=Paracoccus sp. TaxID=267 RepID=UPI002AFFE789|nr:FAD-dependent tricarballylate dehydrogenase TcuA [Paracoccus sp. (in: a-proteobacteria)]